MALHPLILAVLMACFTTNVQAGFTLEFPGGTGNYKFDLSRVRDLAPAATVFSTL